MKTWSGEDGERGIRGSPFSDQPCPPPRDGARILGRGLALCVLTLLVVIFNAWFFWFARDGRIVHDLLTWDWLRPSRGGDWASAVLFPTIVVASPALGLLVSLCCAIYWSWVRGRASRRTLMIWTICLSAAIGGWPVACGCYVGNTLGGNLVSH